MGIVHLGHDTVLDRPVALKELPAGLFGAKELIDRFRVEARALAKLAHPGIVQVYDLVDEPNAMFMAMELVEGGDLDQRIEASGATSAGEVARIGAALAEALRFAHERGVVHRDFKPQNVLMTPEGQPKITDFGIAKLAHGPKLTQTGAVMGTPAYMSPEQASGMVIDARTDVYALGITLYELATGKVPFEGETAAVLVQHLTETPAAPNVRGATLPEAIESLILRMLAKEPDARPTLHEVEATLRAGTS
jgi:serine/threonine-protein kinase